MQRILKALKEIREYLHGDVFASVEKRLNIIEEEVKEYQKVAKRYKWQDITSGIFDIKTDKKFQDLFSSAMLDIQEDYRKARAFDIVKYRKLLNYVLKNEKCMNMYHLSKEEKEFLKKMVNL